MHERALEIREKALGPDHPDVAQSLYNVGEVLLEMGEIERATKVLERSLAILEKAMGPDRPELAYPLQALGRAHVRLHQLDVAGRLFDRALGLVDKPDGDKPLLAWTLWGDGELATARGRTRDAVAILERAMSLAVTFVRPRVELALADALWAGQIDRPRARVLAEDARTFYSTTGDARRGEQASRWLGDHPPERLAVLAR
jgi:tetratricopeptide (TPR) repeat protein